MIIIGVVIIVVFCVLYLMSTFAEYLEEPQVEGGWESPSLTSGFIIAIIAFIIIAVIIVLKYLGIL